MIHLHHPHLVSFYGAGRFENGATFLVTELMAKGTLAELLADHFGTFSWAEKRSFASDIASGMLFLHTRRPPMVHRDLKADNVLVSAGMEIKICDFGTAARLQAEVLEEQLAVETEPLEADAAAASPGKRGVYNLAAKYKAEKTLDVKGSPLWMAPELLQRGGGRHVTTANDVYSYGHVVCELSHSGPGQSSPASAPLPLDVTLARLLGPPTHPTPPLIHYLAACDEIA